MFVKQVALDKMVCLKANSNKTGACMKILYDFL